MNVWPRALALAVAVVLAALVLKAAPPIVVLLVFVGAIAVGYSAARRVRERGRRPALELLGLEPADGDRAGLLASALSLFGRVRDPSLEGIVRGRRRSVEVHAFTLTFDPPAVAGVGGERASLACATGTLGAGRSGLVVEPQAFLASLGGPGPGDRVSTGDGAFDDAMHVWAEDEAAALEFLSPSTRGWLRSLDQTWGIEIRGPLAAVYGPGSERTDPAPALETLGDLIERLPSERAPRSHGS